MIPMDGSAACMGQTSKTTEHWQGDKIRINAEESKYKIIELEQYLSKHHVQWHVKLQEPTNNKRREEDVRVRERERERRGWSTA